MRALRTADAIGVGLCRWFGRSKKTPAGEGGGLEIATHAASLGFSDYLFCWVSLLVLLPLVLELPVELAPPALELVELTFTSADTRVTPCVSSASAMARPTVSASSAVPSSFTSPLSASTSSIALEVSLSA